jgi:hypothetical protein
MFLETKHKRGTLHIVQELKTEVISIVTTMLHIISKLFVDYYWTRISDLKVAKAGPEISKLGYLI